MKTKLVMRFVLVIFSLLAEQSVVKADDRMVIYTVNYPLQYFAQRIAEEQAEVVFPAPRGIDPAYWNPAANEVGDYQRADLILLNGANYAKWLNKVSLPRFRLINTSRHFSERYINIESSKTHSHGAGADHAHSGTAFTTWLDMQQAIQQAELIKQALIKKRPQFSEQFNRNFESLKRDLLAVDKELKETVVVKHKQAVLVSHPVYQYLARRYTMNLHSVMLEPDEFPDKAQWKQLEQLKQKHDVKWIVWEGQPATESVERLKQLGISSAVFNPCANVPAEGDFLSVMKNNLMELKRVY